MSAAIFKASRVADVYGFFCKRRYASSSDVMSGAHLPESTVLRAMKVLSRLGVIEKIGEVKGNPKGGPKIGLWALVVKNQVKGFELCLKTNSTANCICKLPTGHKGKCICSDCGRRFNGEWSTDNERRGF